MTIKLNIPDDSPQNKKRMVAASGAYNAPVENNTNNSKYTKSTVTSFPITKTSQYAGTGANVMWTQPQYFSPIHTPQNWQTPSRRKEMIQWVRFYYLNSPKVAAGIDFYSYFPLNGFKLECKNKKVLKFYEDLVEKLELVEKLNSISHEYFLVGDAFPFLEISCPKCQGRNVLPDGSKCKHPDGSFKSVKIMNPDYMEVKDNPIASKPEYYLIPDDELRLIVQRKEPRQIYNRLPQELIKLIMSGQPIPLSDRSISHLKHNASDYATYGTPLMQRLFTTLAYQTKIMTANWIIAERLIIPIRIVKVGDKERPAQESDIQDIANQLAAVANDPNLTLVTHNAVEYSWEGAEGKIHNITPELEYIGKEILDGLMLNQALLNGEAVSYASAQVGVEVLIRRIESWRNKLKNWVEKHIFLPVAMMQGFVDEEESKKTEARVYLYPKFIWEDLQLRDKTNKIQTLMQLNDKGLVSAQTLLEELDLDYDSEVEKIRNEQIMVSSSGMVGGGGMGGAGGGFGNLGTMGMGGGGIGGGSPTSIAEGGPMGGAPGAGGVPGGAAGAGGPMGGAPGAGGAPMGSAAGSQLPFIGKRGSMASAEKKKKEEMENLPPPKTIRFTKLESRMYKMLLSMKVPYDLYAQYSVKVPGEERPFSIDFAYPQLGVGCEADGEVWHEQEDFKQRDMNRDQKLANIGWRILRFKEDAIEEQTDAVRDLIYKNIVEAEKMHKKSSEENEFIKKASLENSNKNIIYDSMIENNKKIGAMREIISDKIQILYLGEVENV